MPVFGIFAFYMLAEIAGFILVGSWIGLGWTLLLIILAAVLGAAVIRGQGAGAMTDLRGQRRNPAGLLADRILVVLAGVLLILPGFISDLVGLVLLIPPLRALIIAAGARRIKAHEPLRRAEWQTGSAETIEVEYVEIDPTTHQNRPGKSGWTQH